MFELVGHVYSQIPVIYHFCWLNINARSEEYMLYLIYFSQERTE